MVAGDELLIAGRRQKANFPPTGSLVPTISKRPLRKERDLALRQFSCDGIIQVSGMPFDELGNLGLANSSAHSINCELMQKDWKKLAESVNLQ